MRTGSFAGVVEKRKAIVPLPVRGQSNSTGSMRSTTVMVYPDSGGRRSNRTVGPRYLPGGRHNHRHNRRHYTSANGYGGLIS
jgi:hypothetical protein